MDEYEIRVSGTKPPGRRKGIMGRYPGLPGRMIRGLLMRPSAVVFAGLVGFVAFVGTPHAAWDYECRHHVSSQRPCLAYSYCAYYGIQGRRLVFPARGESCPPIAFLAPDWSRLMEVFRND